MSNVITKEQIHEIEELTMEHSDTLIAYGADLYRMGMNDGAKYALQGALQGAITAFAICTGLKISYEIYKAKEINKTE